MNMKRAFAIAAGIEHSRSHGVLVSGQGSRIASPPGLASTEIRGNTKAGRTSQSTRVANGWM